MHLHDHTDTNISDETTTDLQMDVGRVVARMMYMQMLYQYLQTEQYGVMSMMQNDTMERFSLNLHEIHIDTTIGQIAQTTPQIMKIYDDEHEIMIITGDMM